MIHGEQKIDHLAASQHHTNMETQFSCHFIPPLVKGVGGFDRYGSTDRIPLNLPLSKGRSLSENEIKGEDPHVAMCTPQDDRTRFPSPLMGEGEDEGDYKRLTTPGPYQFHNSTVPQFHILTRITTHGIYRIDRHAAWRHQVNMETQFSCHFIPPLAKGVGGFEKRVNQSNPSQSPFIQREKSE